jgi:hypothetical protein
MRRLLPLLLLLPSAAIAKTPAEMDTLRAVLSARLCSFAKTRGEDPAYLRLLVEDARDRLDAMDRRPLPCKDRRVRMALHCLSSIMGVENLPFECTSGHLWAFWRADDSTPLPERPRQPTNPNMKCVPRRGGGENCHYEPPKSP